MAEDSAPPPPNYGPVTTGLSNLATTETAAAGTQAGTLGSMISGNAATSGAVTSADLAAGSSANKFAGDIQKQYENTYVPLEEKFANEAQNYASPENIALQMGRAGATASQQADQSRQNAISDLESYGIKPDSTRYAALDAGLQASKGASVAGAENNARTNTVNTGLALEGQAIGQGEVMPSMAAGLTNEGLMANAGAANTGLATTSTAGSVLGTAPQYYSLANGSYGAYGNTLNQGYQNQIAAFNANQNASSGIGSMLGAGAGMLGALKGTSLMPLAFAYKGGAVGGDHDEDDMPFYPKNGPGDGDADDRPFVDHHFYAFSHDHQFIGTFASPEHAHEYVQSQEYKKRFAKGGAVDGTDGGQVSPQQSPSRGAVTDDVPAVNVTTGQPMAVNSGEFIIPKDVTLWKGQEFLQNLIKKSREAKMEAPAHPTTKPPAQQRAAVG